MNETVGSQQRWQTDELLACLADRHRRTVLSRLQQCPEPQSIEDLATMVVASLTGTPLVDVTRAERDRLHQRLHHNHLPRLAEAGLILWHDDAGTVTASDHPALRDRRVAALLAVDVEGWDSVIRALQPTSRRIALSVIQTEDSIDRETLTNRVVSHENEYASTTDAMATALSHQHLPVLQEAGLILYDGETARYAGHPELDRAWLGLGPEARLRENSGRANGGTDI